MKLLCLLFLVIPLSIAQEFPKELFFSVTYRDFLPSACFYVADLDEVQKAAWDTDKAPNNIVRCDLYGALVDKLISGEISGHPDFEATGSQFVNQNECFEKGVDDRDGINFPASSCIEEQGFDASIIKPLLQVGSNGIPKPVYCIEEDEDARCGFNEKDRSGNDFLDDSGNKIRRQTQTQKKFFDLWYNDNLVYNKRIGQRIILNNVDGTDQFIFDSNVDPSAPDFDTTRNTGFFGPLNRFKSGGNKLEVDDNFINDPQSAEAWPQSFRDRNLDVSGFWFTTELHSTFVFNSSGDMTFTFSGDDDFWAFIDNELVIDIGGMHSEREASIDLTDVVQDNNGVSFSIQDHLGLVDGEIYTLDIFHAERQTHESNFKMTTTLVPVCNVVLSGTDTTTLLVEDEDEFNAQFFTLGKVDFDPDVKTLSLQKQADEFSSSAVYSRNEVNVQRGFIANFTVDINGKTDGIAFVVQSFGIMNYPSSSGGNFNFFGVPNSVAIVLDFCVDRERLIGGEECKEHQVRLHHANMPEEPNNAGEETRKVFDDILRDLTRAPKFNVQVIYFEKPDFLEVYIDNSLFLRQTNFNIVNRIGSAEAHVGITASSSRFAADITLTQFDVKTVDVSSKGTEPGPEFELVNADNLQSVIADGVEESIGFSIITKDLCGNQLDSGTLDEFMTAKYFEIQNSTTGRFEEGRTSAAVVDAVVIDNDDGTYTATLRTEVIGTFGIAVAFGESCSIKNVSRTEQVQVNGTLMELEFFDLSLEGDEENCFFTLLEQAVFTVVPEEEDDDDDSIELVLGIIGCIVGLLIVVAAVVYKYRAREDRRKPFMEKGSKQIDQVEKEDKEAKQLITQEEGKMEQSKNRKPVKQAREKKTSNKMDF